MLKYKRHASIFATTCYCLIVPHAYANQIPQYSLEKEVSTSDTVVLGKIESIVEGSGQSDKGFRYAIVFVGTALKGHPDQRIEVVSRGNAPEEDAGPLRLGGGYLLFLHRSDDGRYHAVNGPNSVYEVP
jgi:hypothetical protein